jgi:hypothetical protein
MKKESVSSLKKKAWQIFSEWVRVKDADYRGFIRCFTCGKVGHYKTFHAGHFLGGRRNNLLFNEIGCHPQCYECNVPKHGNQWEYGKRMVKLYGEKVVKDLEKLNRKNKQFTIFELKEIIKTYQVKLKNL